jgi:mannose-6-phosphate isomerase
MQSISQIYPLRFQTIFKDKIWGGSKIHDVLGKDFSPLPNCGETWEISGMEGNVSVVAEGSFAGKSLNELCGELGATLLGNKVFERFGAHFPLLIKFIDANEDLSIQVHPDDTLGQARHGSFGKTEMWYILQADPGSTLITGFNRDMSPESYQEALESGHIMDVLNKEQVAAGEVYFLPAGRIHTIGKGLLLAEIQQASDITYRIYDFDRVDDKGNKRELHTEQALAAIDYKAYPEYKNLYQRRENEAVALAGCAYFQTNLLELSQPISREYAGNDSFTVLIGTEGQAEVKVNGESYRLSKGDTLLLPAVLTSVEIVLEGRAVVLESFVP